MIQPLFHQIHVGETLVKDNLSNTMPLSCHNWQNPTDLAVPANVLNMFGDDRAKRRAEGSLGTSTPFQAKRWASPKLWVV
jgi:hypothetical protein